MAKNKIPKFLANPSESSRKIAKGLENDATNELHLQAQQIQMDMDDVKVTRLNNRIQIEKKMEENNIIDLKPYFARSSKKKDKKDGGWYLIVPIRVKTSQMSNRMYTKLNKVQKQGKYTNTLIDYIEGTRQKTTVPSLSPKQASKNITKVDKPTNQSHYVFFRTVSDTSPPNSWIINRGNTEGMSARDRRDIESLMRWKMNNL